RTAVVVATGSRVSTPPIDGLDQVSAWDSRAATSSDRVPDRLVVLGGGVVACELAQLYQRLGSQVTIVQRSARLLSSYEPEAASLLQEALAEDGVQVLTGASVERVARRGEDGEVTVAIEGGQQVVGDELLVAPGRSPNTDDIGLDS